MSYRPYLPGKCAECLEVKPGHNRAGAFLCSRCRTADIRLRKRLGITSTLKQDEAYKQALQEILADVPSSQFLSSSTQEALREVRR